jgi:Rieske Fe-S protein
MSVAEKGSTAATIWPVTVAIGVAVVLVGLIINPLVFVPLGGGIAVVGAALWIRGNRTAPSREQTAIVSLEQSGERFPRNRLLERATLGLGGLVALGVGLPIAGFAVLPAFLGQRRRAVNLGPIGAFPEGQFVIATFLSDPSEGEISRRAAYVRNNGLLGGVPSFTILSNRCTHVGCPTQPNGPIFSRRHKLQRTSTGEVGLVPTLPAGGFGCPCHGSEFDTEGNRTAGPAPRALDRYQFSIRNGRLWLGDIYSVSRVQGARAQARIHSYKRLGDGEPASGPESLLYPLDPIS